MSKDVLSRHEDAGGYVAVTRAPAQPHGMGAVKRDLSNVPDDVFVVVRADEHVVGYCGHVDLGTGIATALAQIVAEEMDVPFSWVRMELGHTGSTPNQGATIASETIQVSAIPLRKAAAQAREVLKTLAAVRFGLARDELHVLEGVVYRGEGTRLASVADLLVGVRHVTRFDEDVALKPRSAYRIVGHEVPRVDIPDKATGRVVYVHDVRVPGMLHGRVVRPPYHGVEHGRQVGRSLIDVDRASIAHLPGVVEIVTIGDFVGVVAEREEQAIAAAQALVVRWRPVEMPDLTDIATALRNNPSTPRRLLDRGDVAAALDTAARRLDVSYLWPYQMHGSIGPSCAVADWRGGSPVVWSGTQNPHMLRGDLATLMALPEGRIEIVRHEASGCYGRNCADDVCGDALLLSRAVGRPVRVQLSRAQEHVWEPKGAAQLMEISGGIDAAGRPVAYSFQTRYPSNVSPLLALVLTRTIDADRPGVTQMGDRTCIPPYAYDNARVVVHDTPPIARASWLRGVSAMPNSFAHDSYIDELAAIAGADPLAYRLALLPDARAHDLLLALADRAGWVTRHGPRQPVDRTARVLTGRGIGYAVYVHGAFPGVAAAWAAWIADVAVDRQTGQVRVLRVHVAQDAGMMVNPAGVRHQVHGNIVQSLSRVLKEEVTFDETGVTSRDWGTYPILTFPELPEIDVLFMDRPNDPPLGVGESASVPSAAAIANAVFDATGVRFRELPLTPARVKPALDRALGAYVAPEPAPVPLPLAQRRMQGRPGLRRGLRDLLNVGVLAAAMFQAASTAWPVRRPIAPVPRPDAASFTPDEIARGRVLAAAGDCAVCHTAPGGVTNAGGRALETPFGQVITTNLTPDVETGIGGWSYAAFARAMREGIGRDGRHLYPAFPYTSFARVSDDDLRALYAYLMVQPAVTHAVPETRLAFPYALRPAMAGWNVLFHDPTPYRADPSRSAEWNRGAYLVEGLGHCSACHTPRNALGAEKRGSAYLAGGEADGWIAPPLGTRSRAPVPWTVEAMARYLRQGHDAAHGPALGPMAPVIAEMRALPDADVRAIAVYLTEDASRAAPPAPDAAAVSASALARRADAALREPAGARIFAGSCAACHEGAARHMDGNRPDLALNSNLQDARPDNVIHAILHGAGHAGEDGRGEMPGFRTVLDDGQIASLLRYLRAVNAPGRPAWDGLTARIVALRAHHGGP
ncbi:molybdopterin cofactor-binding domain-containing protein [Gluconacetobacter sacchari]|uniref:molybdopterin cofactor-binding domain-containing protein n=1 Tax=Gluconacetobacter sacchari TaxID=92759 RepID=UPI0039B38547